MIRTETKPPPQPAPVAPPVAGEYVTNGAAAAAFLAAGLGSLILGILTTAAAANANLANMLKISADVGPLSGKVIYTIVLWLIAWGVLHFAWRDRQVAFGKVFAATLVLIGLGVLGTFPLFFDLFAPQ